MKNLMRILPILLSSLTLWGCKGADEAAVTLTSPTPVPAPVVAPPVGVAACAPAQAIVDAWPAGVPSVDYNGLGLFVADDGTYVWVKDYTTNHYYKVDPNTLEMKGANGGLVFSDASCQALVGEVYDNGLHTAGDIYTFQFEGSYFEYGIAANFYGTYNTVTYYFKTENGPCNPCPGPVLNVRQVQASTFVP